MTHVIENVRFRLAPGTAVDSFLEANRAVEAWLAEQPGFVARTLSEGADGEWLDHVEWTGMAAAEAAASAMMTEPRLAPFGQAIAPGVEMRHHRMRWKG
ncbi:hypothetical protein [Roseicyclus persicicus]|uniref:ABM domain-containing protein n=1 Tax=Roseicyclus persicicus TaxID=2650661 RepID=A0A7X6GYE2_9RHOB|nr:hypothetical protein [Roseibacterium persicicum]NKX44694.1 hypothetical protein [Roseibacterium persicicum]